MDSRLVSYYSQYCLMKLIFLHPGDLDATGWMLVGIMALLILAATVAVIGGAGYLVYYLAKKNGERIIRKRNS